MKEFPIPYLKYDQVMAQPDKLTIDLEEGAQLFKNKEAS